MFCGLGFSARSQQGFYMPPGRVIKLIDAMPLNWMGGGMHCASQNEPKSARKNARLTEKE